MSVTLYHVGRRPGQQQFGLDTFIESYKANDAADVVLTDAGVPQKGDAHGSYSGMFVTDRYCQETGPSSSALDIVYTGVFSELPPAQNEKDYAVLSATSQLAANPAVAPTSVTVQYYGPTNSKTFITSGGPATSGFASDPTEDIVVITFTIGGTAFLPVGDINNLIAAAFTQQIIHTLKSTEIVSGQYWNNNSQKQKVMTPFAIDIGAGTAIQMATTGNGYSVGDVLTISAGGESATIHVLSVGAIYGGGTPILSYSVSANTFTVAHTGLTASGGSPTTAATFNVLLF